VGLVNLEQVALALFDRDLTRVVAPRRGRAQAFPLLALLGQVESQGGTDLRTALERYAVQSRTRGVAVVITDLFDAGGYQDGVRSLLRRGFEVSLLHLLSEEELHPVVRGFVRLRDCEGKGWEDLLVDRRAVENYRRNLRAFCQEAEQFCHRLGVTYVRASTAIPFEELIFRRLREGRFLQ
jgi:uncharacterized protein (DUF58 family)